MLADLTGKRAFQNAVNETFNARIGHLEVTTKRIDSKIDLVLESLAPTARKAQ
jgi:uncharacterized coiled-coil protein SlyX